MTGLEFGDLNPGKRLSGVVADGDVTVVALDVHGAGSATLTYRSAGGSLGERIISLDDLAGFSEVSDQRWHFDADGAAFRLASEARRMQSAHLADPYAAVDTSNIEPYPHQIDAVYNRFLEQRPLKFLLAPDATHSANDKHSPAVVLAQSILDQRHGGPRLNRNLLVFVASAANRLGELRGAARLYLAWRSIVDEHEALDLTPHQKGQAESKAKEISQQVDSLISETFTQVLTPKQEAGTKEIEWQTTRATASGDIGARVSRKLATEEKMIANYSGVRVRMDIDRRDLWSEQGDVTVGKLRETYARFLHMPRLSSSSVLDSAISTGPASIDWAQETFAYAEAHDGSTWVGIRKGEHVNPTPSGLLIHPDRLPNPPPPEPSDQDGSPPSADPLPPGTEPAAPSAAPNTGPTQFYAQFDLDPVRCIKELGEIADHISSHLGPNVELVLEIRATNPKGFEESTQRTVSENATNLNAVSSEFE